MRYGPLGLHNHLAVRTLIHQGQLFAPGTVSPLPKGQILVTTSALTKLYA